jgi:hypothetical protein
MRMPRRVTSLATCGVYALSCGAFALSLVATATWVTPAYAVGGDDVNTANQVTKYTELCEKQIGKKGRIFVQKRLDALNLCIDKLLKCDEQSNQAKADECRQKLIEEGKGRCAKGKLDSGVTTLGAGASDSKLKSDKPTLDKELAKYRDAIAKKCFDPNKPVDLDSVAQGLGFTGGPFANADRLMDVLNADPHGMWCIANGTVDLGAPVADDIFGEAVQFDNSTINGRILRAAFAIKEDGDGVGLKKCAN